MVTNFDKETAPLNEIEQKALGIIASCLCKHHVGRSNVVSSDSIAKGMMSASDDFCRGGKPYLNGARIRKIINRIRIEGLVPCLIATNDGYYVSDNPEEVRDYIRSLNERIGAMQAVAMSLTSQLKEKYKGMPAAEIKI